MRVLIYGGTRFIGKIVVDNLLASGHQVTLISRREASPHPQLNSIKIEREDSYGFLGEMHFDCILDFMAYEVKAVETAVSLDQLKDPSATVLFFEASDQLAVSAVSSACVACSRSWNLGGWNTVIKDIQPDRHRSGLAVEDRSEGKANYLFADGHVQLVDANIIKSMIEAGLNPAKPSNFKL